MKTRPSPRGMPSANEPTITQPIPVSEYGSQARAIQCGVVLMTISVIPEAGPGVWRTDEDTAIIDLEWQLQRVGGHPLTPKANSQG
jgi:hypothetical protein